MYYVLHTHRSSSGNFHLTFVLQGFVSSARCHIFPFVNSHFFSLSLVSCSGECKWFNHWFLHSVTFQLHSFFSSSFFIFLSLSLDIFYIFTVMLKCELMLVTSHTLFLVTVCVDFDLPGHFSFSFEVYFAVCFTVGMVKEQCDACAMQAEYNSGGWGGGGLLCLLCWCRIYLPGLQAVPHLTGGGMCLAFFVDIAFIFLDWQAVLHLTSGEWQRGWGEGRGDTKEKMGKK